jgi:hypothetical protein
MESSKEYIEKGIKNGDLFANMATVINLSIEALESSTSTNEHKRIAIESLDSMADACVYIRDNCKVSLK